METLETTTEVGILFHPLDHVLDRRQTRTDNPDAVGNRVTEDIVVNILSSRHKDTTRGLSIVCKFAHKGEQLTDVGPLSELALDGRQFALSDDNVELMSNARACSLTESISRWKDAQRPLLPEGLVELLNHEILELLPRTRNTRRQLKGFDIFEGLK
jgi:hypothetical protein